MGLNHSKLKIPKPCKPKGIIKPWKGRKINGEHPITDAFKEEYMLYKEMSRYAHS